MKKQSGFTLIELLVVIAIIAILAAILFPVFAKAREKARQITCASNLKQLGIACLSYTEDYDEQLPSSWATTPGNSNPATGAYKWMDAVYPYVKSVGVYHCPDDAGQNGSTGNYVFYQNLTGQSSSYYGSYGMNSSYWGTGGGVACKGPGNGPGIGLSQLNAPSTTIWIGDGDGSYQIDWQGPNGKENTASSNGFTEIGTTGSNGDGALTFRHGGPDIANALFCDGHVKSLNAGQAVVTAVEADNNTYDYLFICNGQ